MIDSLPDNVLFPAIAMTFRIQTLLQETYHTKPPSRPNEIMVNTFAWRISKEKEEIIIKY